MSQLGFYVNAIETIEKIVSDYKSEKKMTKLLSPIETLAYGLAEIATRCNEIDDPKLNALMLQMGLFESVNVIADVMNELSRIETTKNTDGDDGTVL